jgi:2-dehydropantoate 2-reductase
MRFHVVGAGAIGGITGAFLARHGEDVHFVDVVPDHVAAIDAQGMRVDGVAGEFSVRARASLMSDVRGPLDVVLLAVKSQHTAVALDGIEPCLGPESLVVSLQNGLNPDTIAARIGAGRVAGAFINFAADYIAPGHIRYGGAGEYYLGRLDGPPDARLRDIAERFGRIMPAILTDNIMGYLWAKECYGCLLIGTALVDAPVHEIVARPEPREVLTAAVVEAVRAADACGVRLEAFEPFEPALFRPPLDRDRLDAFYERVAERFRARVKQHTGIWRDLRVRRRKTEVEFLTGELIRRAGARGVLLPVNARMARMIAEIEQGRRQHAWENLAELRVPSAPA